MCVCVCFSSRCSLVPFVQFNDLIFIICCLLLLWLFVLMFCLCCICIGHLADATYTRTELLLFSIITSRMMFILAPFCLNYRCTSLFLVIACITLYRLHFCFQFTSPLVQFYCWCPVSCLRSDSSPAD
jgi:hypothetical protein